MVQNLFGNESDGVSSPDEKNHRSSGGSAPPDPDSIKINEFSINAPFSASPPEPTSLAETGRRDGLAWSAGIAFFASVVFMLVLGWGADLLLGSSPWGIVSGIVIGSLIGFVQLFRLSSQIFKK